MTDKQNPTVAALRDSLSDTWKDLPKDKQETIKKVASEIEAMAATVVQQETALEGAPLAEAHSSANIFMVDPATKANVQFTFRGHTDADVERRVVEFLTRTTGQQTAQHWLTQDAYRDANWGNKGGDKQPQPKQQAQPAPAPAQQAGNGQKTETFNAELLTATTIDDKVYWKVKGGKYQKYGVTIWPEVLEAAGFDVEALNPQQEYDVSGRTAIVQFKSDGKIDKVIEL